MHIQPLVIALSAAVGLLAGTLIVFVAPRLVAYRLDEKPPYPSVPVLLPLGGAWFGRWRPLTTIALELGAAAIFGLLAVHYGSGLKLVLACAFSTILLAIAYIDLDHRLVLNRLSYPGLAFALAASVVWPGFGLVNAALGALVGLAVFGALQILGRGALGTGDTKLAVLIGAMVGLPGVLGALFVGIVFGGLGAIFFLTVLRRGRKDYMAYAPYLSAGGVLALFLFRP